MPFLSDGRHDWPEMLTIAMEIGWTPVVFWDSTPAELTCALEGSARALKKQQELAAWHAANVMQMWTKKNLTVAKLLGREKQQFHNREEMRAYYAKHNRKSEDDA